MWSLAGVIVLALVGEQQKHRNLSFSAGSRSPSSRSFGIGCSCKLMSLKLIALDKSWYFSCGNRGASSWKLRIFRLFRFRRRGTGLDGGEGMLGRIESIEYGSSCLKGGGWLITSWTIVWLGLPQNVSQTRNSLDHTIAAHFLETDKFGQLLGTYAQYPTNRNETDRVLDHRRWGATHKWKKSGLIPLRVHRWFALYCFRTARERWIWNMVVRMDRMSDLQVDYDRSVMLAKVSYKKA